MTSTCSDHGSLEIVDECPLEVLPGVDGGWFKAFKPSEGPLILDGDGVATNPLARVLLAVILGNANRFEILRVRSFSDVGGERGEAVIIIGILISVGLVSSPCLNDAPRIATVVDLLP
jgi:hypothetical protein